MTKIKNLNVKDPVNVAWLYDKPVFYFTLPFFMQFTTPPGITGHRQQPCFLSVLYQILNFRKNFLTHFFFFSRSTAESNIFSYPYVRKFKRVFLLTVNDFCYNSVKCITQLNILSKFQDQEKWGTLYNPSSNTHFNANWISELEDQLVSCL